MKLNRTAKILITTGATLLTGAFLFGRKAKASPLNNDPSGQSVIVTNHDQVYDYKYEYGVWYTRKKGGVSWIDMKSSLSPQDYQLAVSRLQKYV